MKYFVLISVFLLMRIAVAQSLDFRILKSVNHSYTPTGGKVFKTITNSINPISLGLPVGLCLDGVLTKNSEIRWNSYELGSASILTSLLTTGLKLSIS